MENNPKRIDKLVKHYGMQVEMERLVFAGLTYEGLAEVLDSVLNPDSKFCNDRIRSLFFSLGEAEYTKRTGRRGYKMAKLYFGIGTSSKRSLSSIAKEEGLSSTMAKHYIMFISSVPVKEHRHKFPIVTDFGALAKLKKDIYNKALEKILESSETTRSTQFNSK